MKKILYILIFLLVPTLALSETGNSIWNNIEPDELKSVLEPLTDGSKGNDVIILQEKLISFGCEIGTIDGVYGSQTHLAVASFQEKAGLPVTGTADIETQYLILTMPVGTTFIIDNAGFIYHLPGCPLFGTVDGEINEYYSGTSESLENAGYSPCAICNPKEKEVIAPTEEPGLVSDTVDYVLNTNTMKFHHIWCDSVNDIKPENRYDYTGSRDRLIDMGYIPCKKCDP